MSEEALDVHNPATAALPEGVQSGNSLSDTNLQLALMAMNSLSDAISSDVAYTGTRGTDV